MRAACLLSLMFTVACAFPDQHLKPIEGDPLDPRQDCRGIGGLSLCLRFLGWDYGGLVFEVTAHNSGVEALTLDPTEFRCIARNPQGATRGRWALNPRAEHLPTWDRERYAQEALQKHTLAPGERIVGKVYFAFLDPQDAAYNQLRITTRQENRDYEFRFEPGPRELSKPGP